MAYPVNYQGTDPNKPLPPELENQPISQPVGMPNQFGGAVTGAPTNPDPNTEEAAKARLEAQRAKANADLAAFNAAHPGLAGNTGANPVIATPAATPPAPAPQVAPVASASPVADVPPAGAPVIPPLPAHQGASSAPRAANPAAPPPDPTSSLKTGAAGVDLADAQHSKAMAATGEAENEAAGLESDERATQARDLKTQQALQAMDRQEADRKVQEARDAYAQKKFTGLFRNKDGSTNIGRVIAGGIATILGNLSFDSNHHNQVIGQIDNAIKQHFEEQQAEKADLWRGVQAAIDAKQALRADQLQEMADFRVGQAAALDAVIAKGKHLVSLSKNKEGIAAIEANNARLGFERDKAIDESTRLYQKAAEEKRVHDSEIARNYAQAAHARAAASNEKTTGNQLKIDKAMDLMFAKDEALARGTARSVGPVGRLEAAKAIKKSIEDAVASKDPERIKAAIASAREQSSRILTGAAPTSVSTHLVTELQGKMSEIQSKISSIVGSPTEGKQFVSAIGKLVDGIIEENTSQKEAMRRITEGKFKSTNAYKNPELRAAGEQRINAIFGEPEAPKAQIPPGWVDTGRTAGGKKVYVSPDGKQKGVFE